MDNREHKIIADKLNGLQELPAGYSPNLASKWEIISQSLSKKDRGNAVKKWRLGLLLLLLLGIATWRFYPAKEMSPASNSTVVKEVSGTNKVATIALSPAVTTLVKERKART